MGAMAALMQRKHTGRGQEVQAALFENNIFLVAQHMLQFAVTGKAAAPMPEKISPWGVYDVFKVQDDAQIFLAVVGDTQWRVFCDAFGFADLFADARLATNNDRVRARDWLIPILRERFAGFAAAELSARFEQAGLPWAPITRPQDLFADPHLQATGGLAPMRVPADASSAGQPVETLTALLPISIDGRRLPVRTDPPTIGADSRALLGELGLSTELIDELVAAGIVGVPADPA